MFFKHALEYWAKGSVTAPLLGGLRAVRLKANVAITPTAITLFNFTFLPSPYFLSFLFLIIPISYVS